MNPVCKLSEIPVGGSKVVDFEGCRVAIFRTGKSNLHAINNTCPHKGGPLAEGFVDGHTVTCPWHAWTFDIRNGSCHTVSQDRIRAYRVQVKADQIHLSS